MLCDWRIPGQVIRVKIYMMAISIQVSAKHFEFKKKKLMTELLLFDMSILRWMFGNMPKVYK